ncbi:LPXTG cell wall anchor domain-containing protein [Streptococcus chenjunshii]|uniref:LPXTG cell wall anchor domain-containing protein n=1 Tax=Streptococcus chenjunshii TaxID=2173853 RepID=A0A372KNX9_9STRE|nr:collagen binding domain-containing protein [Streptococcus chenjunshii]AXQ78997.1 LPXTG cell wall anchor domain-containing protein [Streptococcus chenjunshii]RFU51424.1 LPXTG cell wall anchor domain-containing protein [Streptococcus chenjunshii]RFU53624.1 LPXTG cell wall anchor domain-containing protein [Streptococcus chenjunshii]
MKMKRKLLSLFTVLAALVGIFSLTQTVKADQITNYTNTATLTKENGTSLSENSTVGYWEPLAVSNRITFPDEQAIKEGDTLTLKLPEQLRFSTTIPFDVMHASGDPAGQAVINSETGEVTVTFTDIFERLPLDKEMSLNFNVQVNHDTVPTNTPIDITYEGVVYPLVVEENTVVPVSPVITKTGYQDDLDSSIIHWRVLINSQQSTVDNLTVADTLGEGQELLPETMLGVQVQYVEGDAVDSLEEAASRPYSYNFSADITYTTDDLGKTNGFRHTIGGSSNNAVFLSYDTRLTSAQSVGTDMTNSIAVSGENVAYSTETGYARIEAAYGSASSRIVPAQFEATTTTTQTTTENATTTEAPTTTAGTTTEQSVTTEEGTTTESSVTTSESAPTSSSSTSDSTSATSVSTSSPSLAVTSSQSQVKKNKKSTLPSTGEDSHNLLPILGVMLIAVLVWFFPARKLRK